MSSNARPVPEIALDRAVSKPFETKWLSWLGPVWGNSWDDNIVWGFDDGENIVWGNNCGGKGNGK